MDPSHWKHNMELVKNFTQFAKAQKQLAGLCDKIDVAYTEVRSALGGNRATWSIRPNTENDTTSAEELKTFLEGLRDFIRQSSTHYVRTSVTFDGFDPQVMRHVSAANIDTKSPNCLPEQNRYPLTFSQTAPISFERRAGLPQVSFSKYKNLLKGEQVNYITEQVQLEDKAVEKPVALFHNLSLNQTQEIMEKKQKYEEEVQKDEVKKIVREHRSREKIIEKIEGNQNKMDQVRQRVSTRIGLRTQPKRSPSILHGALLQHSNLFNKEKVTTDQTASPITRATSTPISKLDKVEDSQVQKLTVSKPLTGQLHASKPYQRPALKKAATISQLRKTRVKAAKQAALSTVGQTPLVVRSKLGDIIKLVNGKPVAKRQVYSGKPQQRPAMQSPIKHFVNKSENSSKISRLYRPNFNNKLETAKPLNQKAPQVNVSNNNYRSNYLKQYRLAKELDRKRKHKSFTNIRFPSFYWQNKDNFKPSHKPSNIWSSFVGHNGKRPFANL